MTAIERIQGFACEVDQEKWEELVRVADSVGLKVWGYSRNYGTKKTSFAQLDNSGNYDLCLFDENEGQTLIPYPDFLAKLKGDEKWEPKNGELVEVSDCRMIQWIKAEYIAFSRDVHVVWCEGDDDDDVVHFENVRPARPTITRTEAEALLNKRIID